MGRAVVSLPNGLQNSGSWTKEAVVREPTGYDEESIAETSGQSKPRRTSALLGRLVSFEGKSGSDNSEAVRRLALGDRVALVLGIRRMLFGDRLDCLVACPSCGSEMSVELSAASLAGRAASPPAEGYELESGGRKMKLRPIEGADLESACESDVGGAREERLITSCVVASDPPLPDKLPDGLLSSISEKLLEMDPMADVQLDLACPACKARFQTPFSAEDFLFQEMRYLQPQLEKEVHWIAFNYKWSEGEILSLPVTKRKRFVELINRTLAGEAV